MLPYPRLEQEQSPMGGWGAEPVGVKAGRQREGVGRGVQRQ